ncbi:MAG: hypothetical protein L0Z62_44870, partial [Gemmataceae bacterium]|nr:hypothetical protein [Gemmataceae bacterium]
MMRTGAGKVALLTISLTCLFAEVPALAQPAAPPPPREYKVHLRYRIRAGRSDRIAQFFEMTRYFESLGFRKDPGPENEAEDWNQTRMSGLIPSATARRLLVEPHVKALLLIPATLELPPGEDTPVKVQLQLTGGLPLDRQNALAEQVSTLLRDLGFREAIGYDNRGHTRLVGTMPAGRLDLLLEDLRWQSSGWLVPQVPVAELPLPLRNTWPLVATEVIPEPAGVTAGRELPAPAELPREQAHLLKITPDLRALVAQEGEAARPARVEVILASLPPPGDRSWRRALTTAAPEAIVEGRLGPVVTLLARAGQASDLAALPFVASVRLPRSGAPLGRPSLDPRANSRDVLQASGLDRLHQLGYRGRGVRLAVIDSDFRGYQPLVGKQLPGALRYLDLTAERRPDLRPEPQAGDLSALGHGTQCALAIALAAPEAELTLIRIDPASPFQLETVARFINRENYYSESLEQRSEELVADARRLAQQREELLAERRAVLDSFKQDEKAAERRAAYFQKQAEFDREETELHRRQERFLKLLEDLKGLAGIRVVSCALVWNDGYAVDGSSPLSRYFDDSPFRAAFWFQAAGNTHGQTWAGRFRDVDGNGVLEFAGADVPPGSTRRLLRQGQWTPELNFFAWQPPTGPQSPELPANAKIRLSIQWREVHEPEFWTRGEDLYRTPLVNLRLVVLRQRDPTGTKLPADDLEVVARSEGLPQRLDKQPSWATYEQMLEFTIDTPGRYAVRVEGRMPDRIRPASEPMLPALQKSWELWPRLFVQVLDEPARALGRAVFLDYPTALGSIGMPADAQRLITVAAADLAGRLQAYSATGPALRLELLPKPEIRAHDGLHVVREGTPA